MKRVLVLIGISTIVAAVAGLTAAPAKAVPLCEATSYTTGLFHNTITAVGNSISAHVESNGSGIYNGNPPGQTRSFVGVDNGAVSQYVQAGIIQMYGQSTGVQYIEWKGSDGVVHRQTFGTATNGLFYTDIITHSGNGLWTAQIGSNVVSNIQASGMVESTFYGYSTDDQSGKCNSLSFEWTHLSPWTDGLLTQSYNGVTCPWGNSCMPLGYPYLISGGGLGNYGFKVAGGG